jgi:hypothetical protein
VQNSAQAEPPEQARARRAGAATIPPLFGSLRGFSGAAPKRPPRRIVDGQSRSQGGARLAKCDSNAVLPYDAKILPRTQDFATPKFEHPPVRYALSQAPIQYCECAYFPQCNRCSHSTNWAWRIAIQ